MQCVGSGHLRSAEDTAGVQVTQLSEGLCLELGRRVQVVVEHRPEAADVDHRVVISLKQHLVGGLRAQMISLNR